MDKLTWVKEHALKRMLGALGKAGVRDQSGRNSSRRGPRIGGDHDGGASGAARSLHEHATWISGYMSMLRGVAGGCMSMSDACAMHVLCMRDAT
jgi:hypothetical protein